MQENRENELNHENKISQNNGDSSFSSQKNNDTLKNSQGLNTNQVEKQNIGQNPLNSQNSNSSYNNVKKDSYINKPLNNFQGNTNNLNTFSAGSNSQSNQNVQNGFVSQNQAFQNGSNLTGKSQFNEKNKNNQNIQNSTYQNTNQNFNKNVNQVNANNFNGTIQNNNNLNIKNQNQIKNQSLGSTNLNNNAKVNLNNSQNTHNSNNFYRTNQNLNQLQNLNQKILNNQNDIQNANQDKFKQNANLNQNNNLSYQKNLNTYKTANPNINQSINLNVNQSLNKNNFNQNSFQNLQKNNNQNVNQNLSENQKQNTNQFVYKNNLESNQNKNNFTTSDNQNSQSFNTSLENKKKLNNLKEKENSKKKIIIFSIISFLILAIMGICLYIFFPREIKYKIKFETGPFNNITYLEVLKDEPFNCPNDLEDLYSEKDPNLLLAEFTGWYTDKDFKNKFTGTEKLEGDLTLYAGFKAGKVKTTFVCKNYQSDDNSANSLLFIDEIESEFFTQKINFSTLNFIINNRLNLDNGFYKDKEYLFEFIDEKPSSSPSIFKVNFTNYLDNYYDFLGFSKNINDEASLNVNSVIDTPNHNSIIYLSFKPKEITLNFNSNLSKIKSTYLNITDYFQIFNQYSQNDIKDEILTQKENFKTVFNLKSYDAMFTNSFMPNIHKFLGWCALHPNQEGFGKYNTFLPNSAFLIDQGLLQGKTNITLYAVWDENDLTFNLKDSSIGILDKKIYIPKPQSDNNVNISEIISNNDLLELGEKEGYALVGFNTKDDDSGTVLTSSDYINLSRQSNYYDIKTDSINLFVIYKKIFNKIYINLKDDLLDSVNDINGINLNDIKEEKPLSEYPNFYNLNFTKQMLNADGELITQSLNYKYNEDNIKIKFDENTRQVIILNLIEGASFSIENLKRINHFDNNEYYDYSYYMLSEFKFDKDVEYVAKVNDIENNEGISEVNISVIWKGKPWTLTLNNGLDILNEDDKKLNEFLDASSINAFTEKTYVVPYGTPLFIDYSSTINSAVSTITSNIYINLEKEPYAQDYEEYFDESEISNTEDTTKKVFKLKDGELIIKRKTFEFTGFFTSNDFNEASKIKVKENTAFTTIDFASNTNINVVYGGWSKINYTINFITNGGDLYKKNDDDSVSEIYDNNFSGFIYDGTFIVLDDIYSFNFKNNFYALSKEGYWFEGWSKEANSQEAEYKRLTTGLDEGKVFITIDDEFSKDVEGKIKTLYAVFKKKKTATIYLDASKEAFSIVEVKNRNNDLSFNSDVLQGFEFRTFNTSPFGTSSTQGGVEILAGVDFNLNNFTLINDNLDLYAMWFEVNFKTSEEDALEFSVKGKSPPSFKVTLNAEFNLPKPKISEPTSDVEVGANEYSCPVYYNFANWKLGLESDKTYKFVGIEKLNRVHWEYIKQSLQEAIRPEDGGLKSLDFYSNWEYKSVRLDIYNEEPDYSLENLAPNKVVDNINVNNINSLTIFEDEALRFTKTVSGISYTVDYFRDTSDATGEEINKIFPQEKDLKKFFVVTIPKPSEASMQKRILSYDENQKIYVYTIYAVWI